MNVGVDTPQEEQEASKSRSSFFPAVFPGGVTIAPWWFKYEMLTYNTILTKMTYISDFPALTISVYDVETYI